MEQEKEHKRRVRYKGTHPRSYREKYKELNPEKYSGIIQTGYIEVFRRCGKSED